MLSKLIFQDLVHEGAEVCLKEVSRLGWSIYNLNVGFHVFQKTTLKYNIS